MLDSLALLEQICLIIILTGQAWNYRPAKMPFGSRRQTSELCISKGMSLSPYYCFLLSFFFFSFPLIQDDLGCFHTTKIRPSGPTNHPDGNMITALANGMQHFKSSHFNMMYNGTFLKQVNCPDETGILVHTDQILQLQLFKKQWYWLIYVMDDVYILHSINRYTLTHERTVYSHVTWKKEFWSFCLCETEPRRKCNIESPPFLNKAQVWKPSSFLLSIRHALMSSCRGITHARPFPAVIQRYMVKAS